MAMPFLLYQWTITYVFFPTAFPEDGPRIEGLRQMYGVGDYLEANCTAKMTFPAAEVTWYINNLEVSIRKRFHAVFE